MTLPRSLTDRESALIRRLIEVQPEPLRSIYAAQAATARVESVCGCGCPTINLALDASRAARAGNDDRWEIAYAESPLGPIILVINVGWLESLELLYWDGDTPRLSSPMPDEVTPHARLDP